MESRSGGLDGEFSLSFRHPTGQIWWPPRRGEEVGLGGQTGEGDRVTIEMAGERIERRK